MKTLTKNCFFLYCLLFGGIQLNAQTYEEILEMTSKIEGMDSLKRSELAKRTMAMMKPDGVFDLLNHKIPDLTLTTTAHGTIQMKDLLGKKVVMYFWFTACQPCIDVLPALNKIKAQLKDKNIEFISLTSEDDNVISYFLANNEFHFNHMLDTHQVFTQLEIKSCPKLLYVDKDGYIRRIDQKMDMTSLDSREKWTKEWIELLKH